MKNNPYADFLNIIKDNSPQPNLISLGVVLSSNPLKIKVGDLILYRENLLINETLLDYKHKFNLNCNTTGLVNGYHGTGNLENIQIDNKEIEFKTMLKANDLVATIPIENGQKYIVLAKVV